MLLCAHRVRKLCLRDSLSKLLGKEDGAPDKNKDCGKEVINYFFYRDFVFVVDGWCNPPVRKLSAALPGWPWPSLGPALPTERVGLWWMGRGGRAK